MCACRELSVIHHFRLSLQTESPLPYCPKPLSVPFESSRILSLVVHVCLAVGDHSLLIHVYLIDAGFHCNELVECIKFAYQNHSELLNFYLRYVVGF